MSPSSSPGPSQCLKGGPTRDGSSAAYHQALVQAGVRDYALDACRRDVRLGLLTSLQTLMYALGMLEVSSERARKLAAAMIERNAAALEDHGVWEALE